MKPEDVPNDLLNLAANAMVALEDNPVGSRDDLACFLAAILPAHEKFVRAKVAFEIERHSNGTPIWSAATLEAADIARSGDAETTAALTPPGTIGKPEQGRRGR